MATDCLIQRSQLTRLSEFGIVDVMASSAYRIALDTSTRHHVDRCYSWCGRVKSKGKMSATCYSACYTSQSRDQKRFTISEVAADWHELMILIILIIVTENRRTCF